MISSSGVTQTIESLFGPASEVIHISEFVESASTALAEASSAEIDDGDADMDIAQECSVSDIKGELEKLLDDPLLAASLVRDHEHMVGVLYTSHGKNKKPGRKPPIPDPGTFPAEVLSMQKELEDVQLKSWKLNAESAMFIRTPRNSDYNSLIKTRCSPNGASIDSSREGILTISIYNKVPWGPSYVTRLCQHAYLASQSLQDVYDALPCVFGASLPSEGGNPAGMKPGCAVCIEGILYCDSPDYSKKLLGHLAIAKRATLKPSAAHRTLTEIKLSSLSLRLHFPYPLHHAGNCEHFVVVEQIRLWHHSDPTSGYPITLQLTPPLPSLCYMCHKVPATWSVVGDVRLGESPSLVCGPCWDALGEPREEEVVATPIPI